jgi:hypothetical protein
VDHLRGWRALDVFVFTCDSQLPKRKRVSKKNGWPLPFAALFFFLFLSPGKLRAEQTANEKNNNNKEKKKKILGLGFYSDPSIDFAVCFFAYSCCCCVSL